MHISICRGNATSNRKPPVATDRKLARGPTVRRHQCLASSSNSQGAIPFPTRRGSNQKGVDATHKREPRSAPPPRNEKRSILTTTSHAVNRMAQQILLSRIPQPNRPLPRDPSGKRSIHNRNPHAPGRSCDHLRRL